MDEGRTLPVVGAQTADLGELYERYVGRAVGLARLLTGDASIAEDIAHDAFIRSAARLNSLRDPSRFEPYLLRTVVNLCRSRGRRRSLESRFLARTSADQTAPGPAPEVRDVVWAQVLRLPHRQRAAIVLRYFEDLPEERVAQILGCSPKAVNGMVDRAKATLRAALAEEDDT